MATIAIGGFQHETNTFAATPATYQDFAQADGWPALVPPGSMPELLDEESEFNEGPVWFDDLRCLLWSDIPGDRNVDDRDPPVANHPVPVARRVRCGRPCRRSDERDHDLRCRAPSGSLPTP